MSEPTQHTDETNLTVGLPEQFDADPPSAGEKETGTAPTVPASTASTVDQEQGADHQLAPDTKTCNKKPRAKDSTLGAVGKRSAGSQDASSRKDIPAPLSLDESRRLGELHEAILSAKAKESDGATMTQTAATIEADALHEIQRRKLYRTTHTSFEQFASKHYGFERAHANRLAKFGALRTRVAVSPRGDIIKLLTSEKVARPIAKLNEHDQDQVLETLGRWMGWQKCSSLTGRIVEAAVAFKSDARPSSKTGDTKAERRALAARYIHQLSTCFGEDHQKVGSAVLDEISKLLAELLGPDRSTKIQWTNHSWNPLMGCSKASAGCENCYAARLVATLLKKKFGHLVKTVNATENGKKVTRYQFNGKVDLIPERLIEPLQNAEPTMYFVNSMSDLFHPAVPDEFIESVFQTMEKAHWHIFQVLTKRPKRMAQFTAQYFHERSPAENIWLGTSTEDQQTFTERLPDLLATKASVRWLSVEPLLSSIRMDALDGVDWIVVGGESGKNARKMEKQWATEIRDQCFEQKVPFFFKQWGAYGEDGLKTKRSPRDEDSGYAISVETLDGKSHHEFPASTLKLPTTTAPTRTDAAVGSVAA